MNIVAAKTAFSGSVNGKDIDVQEGDLFSADDPVVKKWGELFVPAKVRSTASPRIEQATAAPGEKRGKE
jgi:hypothetical protein